MTSLSTGKVGSEAPDFELAALGGEKVKLSKLTESGPVVLRGYPGYQCPLCTRQVGELIGKADEFKKAGCRCPAAAPLGESPRVKHSPALRVNRLRKIHSSKPVGLGLNSGISGQNQTQDQTKGKADCELRRNK